MGGIKFKFSSLGLDNQDIPLYQKVINMVQREISSGTLKPGAMLPSSREMAEQLGISRKTVVKAIDMLLIKGKLVSKDRIGVFVPVRDNAKKKTKAEKMHQQEMVVSSQEGHDTAHKIVVNDGFPDTTLIPFREFSRAYRQIFNRMAQWQKLGYNDPMGYLKFRNAISDVLARQRGLSINTDEICVVRGSQMALFLVAHAVLSPGDNVAIEYPNYGNAYKAFDEAGLNIHCVPVDKDGIDVDKLETICKQVSINAVYVTPRHQYPTTVTLSMARRQKLRQLSLEYGFFVIEDDFGSDYNFSSRHLAPLSAMLSKSHYIYIGTFSKVFAPGTRLGFVCTSRDVSRRIADYRSLIDIQGDIIAERALYDLYEHGDLTRHVRRSSKIYKERLKNATSEIRRILGSRVSYKQPHGGLAIWIGIPTKMSVRQLEEYFAGNGISISVYQLADGTIGVRIGYAAMKSEELTTLLECISKVVE